MRVAVLTAACGANPISSRSRHKGLSRRALLRLRLREAYLVAYQSPLPLRDCAALT